MSKFRPLPLIITVLLFAIPVFAGWQEADTVAVAADSIKKKSDIDSVIYSSGRDSLTFFVSRKKMYIYGKGDLKYKATQLKSGLVNVDFVTNNVQAEGFMNDSTKKLTETPTLVDKGEEYKGSRMTYNFKSTRGYITYAATKADEASYSGARINKVDKSTFFVENGLYTTCDNPEPHFCFYGREMKVMQKQQMVAKWVWLAFENVPFPIPVPFAVVPLQSGRRSGIIPPAYGEREGYGQYFSHMGYFWAINDYVDIAATTDIYSKGGYGLQSSFRYTKRYDLNGRIEAAYSKLHTGEVSDGVDYSESKQWMLDVQHHQVLTPSSSLEASLRFMSADYNKQNVSSLQEQLNQSIYSSAQYSKTWEDFGASMSAAYSRDQEIQTGNTREVLPSISFSKSQFYPFRPKNQSGEEVWYEMIGINYSGSFLNNRNKTDGDLKIRGGIRHGLSTGISPKIGYFNISPGISYNELWYNKSITKRVIVLPSGKDSVAVEDVKGINFVRTFSLSVGTSTKFYGMFQPQMAGVEALRHIITPTVSFTYTPDFSEEKWGYYKRFRYSDGRSEKYNRHEREVFGGASSGRTQSMNFSVGNSFEMKTMVDPTDTTSKEQKIQLLSASIGASYNFAADSLRLSDIGISYSKSGDFFSLSGNTIYSAYDYNDQGITINKFLINTKKQLLRLKSFSLSAGLNLSGDRSEPEKGSQTDQTAEQVSPAEQQFAMQGNNRMYQGLYQTQEADFSIPWNFSLNYNYGVSKDNPFVRTDYSNMSGDFGFNLTKTWKFAFSGYYDLKEKKFSAPQVTVSRDLHCWIMNFSWNPVGSYTGYRLEIRVKAPTLQDLKITKTSNFFSGRN